MDKAPIGIISKNIWESIRFQELREAIKRYLDADLQIPIQWIDEYNEFSKRIINPSK